jgi:Cu/Ag efflux pump CusA
VTSQVVTIGSFVGMFAVFALGVRFALTQINTLQRIERDDGEEFGPALVLRGAHERAIPTVTTAIVAGLALAPFALSSAAAGQEVVHPMAVAIAGGLVTMTLLTLFVVPLVYLRFRSPVEREPDVAEIVRIPEIEMENVAGAAPKQLEGEVT